MREEFPPRSAWGPGPWQDEPDNAYWKHAGYLCMALRGPFGSWCGYVAVGPKHPFWGKDPSACIFNCEPTPRTTPAIVPRFADMEHYECRHTVAWLVHVHGGVTWGSYGNAVIHHPRADSCAWYFGFDCGHAWDIAPGMNALLRKLPRLPGEISVPDIMIPGSSYKTLDYVRKEVDNLAEQCAGYGRPRAVELDKQQHGRRVYGRRDSSGV